MFEFYEGARENDRERKEKWMTSSHRWRVHTRADELWCGVLMGRERCGMCVCVCVLE